MVVLLTALIGFQSIPSDPDLWFHLADGRMILANGCVPRADPFSFTRANELWVPHSWLFDVLAATSWDRLGPRTSEALMALAYMVTFVVLFRMMTTNGASPMIAALVVAGLAIAAGNTRGIRPQVLSLLLTSLMLTALIAHKSRPGLRIIIVLPLMFLLWAQLHAACVMGLIVCLTWLIGRAADSIARRDANCPAMRELALLVAALMASGLAILITPHAMTHYEYLRLTMELTFLRVFVAEWQAPQLWAIPDVYQFLLAASVASLAIWRVRQRGRARTPRGPALSWSALGVAGATVALGFTATRHIPLACIGVVPLLSELLPRSDAAGLAHRRTGRRSIVALAAALCGVFVGFWRFPTDVQTRYAAAEPVRGAQALAQLARPLRVFTTYDTGAYVLWSAPARLRVFVDSRADVYGDPLLRIALDAMAGRRWERLFEQFNVQAAVLGRNDPLAAILADRSAWILLAEDVDALTFVSAAEFEQVAIDQDTWPHGSLRDLHFAPPPGR
ncbi:MAG: hypothetical protein IH986_11415 [Planctomycetes bacterium]|nr:hypothetical protein [Planctomycetota bacterium]